MAWKAQKNGGIIINGFESGIADSPELGLADMRSVNITSVPGEASVSPSMAVVNTPIGASGVSYSAIASTDVITVSSTTGYYSGMAIQLSTTSLPIQVSTLIIGGGGGGGGGTNSSNGGTGGGGGAGAVISQTGVSISKTTYPVTFGNLGAGGTGGGGVPISGNDGGSSSFNGTSAAGGGGGGAGYLSGSTGDDGASGGGGGAFSNGTSGVAGNPIAGSTGHAGGNGSASNPTPYAGGGGGGSSTAGTAGGGSAGGNGGSGTTSSITGTSIIYGEGGGGAGSSSGGSGGTNGGAGGGHSAVANTGAGGGGGDNSGGSTGTGGNGASGRVVISYPTGTITATGGTITFSGGNTIHQFTTGAGNFVVSALNPSVGNVYYIGNITGTTFKLYYDVGLTQVVDVIGDITGTFAVPSMSNPVDKAYYQYYSGNTAAPLYATFLIDDNGNCWYMNNSASTGTGGTIAANSLQYAGNVGHATSGTNADFGIFAWNGYLFSIIGRTIGYISLTNLLGTAGPIGAWNNSWKTDLTYTQYQHQSLPATDDAVYICNAGTLASLIEITGQVFDPTNTATYSYNTSALVLPTYDYAQSIAQLGTLLLVGGVLAYIYPWDRTSTSFSYPLICADTGIKRIASTNSNAYVFAGQRGRIYITNGQQIQLYKKIPDSISGNPEPYYPWQDAIYERNKLYFTFTATDNSGNALSTMGGIWSLGIDSGQTVIALPTAGSLFGSNQLSYGTYGGSCPVIFSIQKNNPLGYGIGAAWVNGASTGVDVSSSAPYTGTQTYIDTDIIPIGTYYEQTTNRQLEYKVSKPLVAGESVSIAWRGNLTDSFTNVPLYEGGGVGQVSGAYKVNFQKQQWVQFRITLTSTATTPTYTRLTNIILR